MNCILAYRLSEKINMLVKSIHKIIQMSNAQKIMLSFVMSIFLITLVYSSFLNVINKKIVEQRNQVAKLDDDIGMQGQKILQAQNELRRYPIHPRSLDAKHMLMQISELAIQQHLLITAIKPNINAQGLHLIITGNYASLITFMQTLIKMPFLLKIISFNLKTNNQQSIQLDAIIDTPVGHL
jgi:hypothetical protein